MTRPRAYLTITNVATAQTMEAQYNPTQWELSIKANYSTLTSPGAGYEIDQYSHTSNLEYRIQLIYSVLTAADAARLDAANRFLSALLYPRRGAGSIPQHPPPRAMINWPNGPSFQCTVRDFNIRAYRFNERGGIIEQSIDLVVREYREGQLFSEDVAVQGFKRPSPRAVGGRSD